MPLMAFNVSYATVTASNSVYIMEETISNNKNNN